MTSSDPQEHFETLTDLLEATGARLRLYDMGRRITRISKEQFIRFERYETAWPLPLARHAWLAMVLISDKESEPVIWFVKLPLDEQGKLVQAARDYFVQRLAEAWATNKLADGEQVEDALKDNPFVFKPRDDRMAMFHAMLSRDMHVAASSYYTHAQDYFDGTPGWGQWQFVGYQGIADIAARVDEDENLSRLSGAIALLPPQPLVALCHCLENIAIPHTLAEPLCLRLDSEVAAESPDLAVVTALIRGVSYTRSKTHLARMFSVVMNTKDLAGNPEILAAIAGRAWQLLEDETSASRYLEAVAGSGDDNTIFDAIMRDLLAIPGLRKGLLKSAATAGIEEQLARFQQSLRDERKPDTSST